MNRNDLREVIARALCAADERNPDEMINATYRAWQNYCHGANAALSALDKAGMVVRPKEPTEAMIAAGHQQIDWCRTDQKTDTPYDPSQVFMTGGVRAGTYCGEDIVDVYRAMIAVEEE